MGQKKGAKWAAAAAEKELLLCLQLQEDKRGDDLHSADTEQKLKRYMLNVAKCLGKAGVRSHPSRIKQCNKIKDHDIMGYGYG